MAQIQAMAALQQQQALQRQLAQQQAILQHQAMLQHQQMLAQAQAAAVGAAARAVTVPIGNAPPPATRKQREVYIGNLAVGMVSADILRQLFNTVLANHVPDPVANPPVVEVKMDTTGRFGFVEFRTPELADVAVQLDKMEMCGRQVKIGRPKGYVEPPPGLIAGAKLSAAQILATAQVPQLPPPPATQVPPPNPRHQAPTTTRPLPYPVPPSQWHHSPAGRAVEYMHRPRGGSTYFT